MAQWFAANGWQVSVITNMPYYPRFERYPGYNHEKRADSLGEISILRLPTVVPRRGSAIFRAVSELNFLVQGKLRATRERAERVISVSPGVPWATSVAAAVAGNDGVHLAVVHDIQHGLASSTGMAPRPIASLLATMEARALNKADLLVALTNEMADTLRLAGVRRTIRVIPLWTTLTSPARPASGPPVQYSGALGAKVDLVGIQQLAQCLEERPDPIMCLIRGAGPRFDTLRHGITAAGLSNVLFAAPVPNEDLAEALAMSSVHFVIQEEGSAAYLMPSKVFNALACGCHVVVMTSPASALARLVPDVPGLWTVPHHDWRGMSDLISYLVRHRSGARERSEIAASARLQMGRDALLSQYEDALLGLRPTLRQHPR